MAKRKKKISLSIPADRFPALDAFAAALSLRRSTAAALLLTVALRDPSRVMAALSSDRAR